MITRNYIANVAMTVALIATMMMPASAQTGDFTSVDRGDSLTTFDTIDELAGIKPHIESVWLVDADADVVIGKITDGEVFDRALLPPNLTVMVEANADTESVQFGYGGALAVQTENAMPYAIGGDSGGDYNAYPLPDGWHTIRARPFAADDASGSNGDEVLISFAIFEHEIVVDSTLDAHDTAPGDGICSSDLSGGIDDFTTRTSAGDDGRIDPTPANVLIVVNHLNRHDEDQQRNMAYLAGPCTLRAAVEESNARAGTQRIEVPHLGSNYNTSLGTLVITAPVIIEGSGLPIVDADVDVGYGHQLMRIEGADGVVINGLVLRNGDVRSCCSGNGGNIHINNSTVEIADSQIRDGLGTNGGGIAVSHSELTVLRSRISGNRAGDPNHNEGGIGGVNQWGGGVHIVHSDVTIDSSSIYDNGAVRGAGVLIAGDTEAFIINTAIIENEAFQQGAGIATTTANGISPDVYIAWSTIARNAGTLTAPIDPPGWEDRWTGGGLWINSGDAIIGNSIVAENTILQSETMDTYGPDCYVGANGTFTSYRGNIIGELTDACPLVDPHVKGLLPWDTYGTTGAPFDVNLGNTVPGTRPTIIPLAASAAVDHGSNNEAVEFFGPCPTEDVRGTLRPGDASQCDIGATERQ